MKNYIYTIIGPSGSGKSTIANGNFTPEQTLVSFTTRPPRPGEIDGIDYYFINDQEVEELLKQDQCLEHIVYNGYHYGYTYSEFDKKLKKDSVVAVVNIDGYKCYHETNKYKDLLKPVFIRISEDEVIRHMKGRDDSEENINKRLSFYREEAANEQYFADLGAFILDIDGLSSEEGIAVLSEYIKEVEKKD